MNNQQKGLKYLIPTNSTDHKDKDTQRKDR